MQNKSPFLDTILQLRKDGSLIVYSDLHQTSAKEEQDAADYLQAEFERERLNFLVDTIPFSKNAAIWAAKVIYHSAQLYLIRKDTTKDLQKLIIDFQSEKDISAIISADLTLRFLPQIYDALQVADSEDPLIKMLENILKKFHYSAVGCDLDLEGINWEKELEDKTYRKLYLERIVEKKAYPLAEIPYINQLLMAEFGIHKYIFWRELKNINN
ncbi:hypothetical protein [Chryseobacterium taihuense]|uniref:MoxR-vWA-beta-propeller ternary system domain-containing protein n=1 Tax=Chryseobacterium taihuense TaxID=1141221 RepID=A0ABY0QZS1_9FLAO|nr:hypothetical protein [Chryseobacterium taihuense]SDM16219.1 hypothetical protein SAMN05216273_11534 [Chryseobacterium taihuense]